MSTPLRTITLLRHAKSSWSMENVADENRVLNDRGERDAPIMGARLKQHGIRPSLILSSSAARAWQTAKIVAHEIGYPIEFLQKEPALYLASPATIMQLIAQQDESFHHILVVGHNPGISDLGSELAQVSLGDMPTAAVLSVAAHADEWSDFVHCDRQVVGYDYPKNDSGPITRF